eukprot:Gb_38868 [translate_table: standard]
MANTMKLQAKTEEDFRFQQLLSTQAKLQNIMEKANEMGLGLERMDNKLRQLNGGVSSAAKAVAPLQSAAMVAKALDSRIERAINPAFKVLETFRAVEELQKMVANMVQAENPGRYSTSRLKQVYNYAKAVENLDLLIGLLREECEPAIQRLQEAVEFLSRTKATDHYRAHRLTETLSTLRVLYENEVEDMNDGLLMDEALLKLEDEFRQMLLQIGRQTLNTATLQMSNSGSEHDGIRNGSDYSAVDLASKREIQVLRKIIKIMQANDGLDICIEIYVEVRYRRAAKALARLKPNYLKCFTPEEIDEMEWEPLESSIGLWIQHLEIAVKTVFASEKKLCRECFTAVDGDFVWPECLARVADKVMAIFFRFGEGVARSRKEPQKLFKLLDMFESMENLNAQFTEIFEGDAGKDICLRFRELQKQIVNAACKVFWEFGLQVEGQQHGAPPPDGSVPKLIRYVVNYSKYLASEYYGPIMTKILKIEQLWKCGKVEEQNPFCDAISNIMEALQRNLDSKSMAYKDKALGHLFLTNAHWYMYMRTKDSELGKLLGETWWKQKHKQEAERSAYLYQKEAWGHVLEHLNREGLLLSSDNRASNRSIVKQRLKSFMTAFEETYQRHQWCYCVQEQELREQIISAISQTIVPAYANYLHSYAMLLQQGKKTAGVLEDGDAVLPPDSIQQLLGELFVGKPGKYSARTLGNRPLSSINHSPCRNSTSSSDQHAPISPSKSRSLLSSS